MDHRGVRGLLALALGTGGIIVSKVLDPSGGAVAALSYSTMLGASLGAISGNLAYDGVKNSFGRISAILEDAGRANRLPLNHDFAKALRRAQLDGVRYILIRYRKEVRALPMDHDVPAAERFAAALRLWLKREARHIEDNDFLLDPSFATYLRTARNLFIPEDLGAPAQSIPPLLAAAEAHMLAEIAGALEDPVPHGFVELFAAGNNLVCWQSAATAFFVEAIKSDPRLATVMLFDRLDKIDRSLEALTALTRTLAGELGQRLGAIERESAGGSTPAEREDLQAFLRGALFEERLEFDRALKARLDARFPKEEFQASITAAQVAERVAILSQSFVGRADDLRALRDPLSKASSTITVVTAPPGFGKSALMAAFARRLADEGADVVRHFCSLGFGRTIGAADVFGHLVAQIAALDGLDQRPELSKSALADWLHERLRLDRDGDRPLYLLIDGLDECADPGLAQIVGQRLGSHVHLIVSCRAAPGECPRAIEAWLQPRTGVSISRHDLPAMSRADIGLWLGMRIALADATVLEGLVRKLERASDGIPLFIRYLLDDLEALGSDQAGADLLGAIADLPEPFDRYVAREIERLDREVAWSSGAEFLFALLTRAKVPIALEDADRLLRDAHRDGLIAGELNMHRLDHRIARWFQTGRSGTVTTLRFAHPRLAAIFARVLDWRVAQAESALIALSLAWRDRPSAYAYRAGVEHLLERCASGAADVRLDEAVAPLRDLEYLSRRGREGNVYQVLDCLRKAVAIDPSDSWLRAWFASVSADYSILVAGHHGGDPNGVWGDKLATADRSASRFSRTGDRAEGVFDGHSGDVEGALWIEECRRVLSWSADATLRLWDLDGTPAGNVMEGHAASIERARWIASERLILSWSYDNSLRLWDEDGNPVGVPMTGHTGNIRDAIWLDHCRRVVSCSLDGSLRVWADDGTPLGDPSRDKSYPTMIGAVWLERSQQILSWCGDNSLRFWDDCGRPVATTLPHGMRAWNGPILSTAKDQFACCVDKTVYLYDSFCQPVGQPLCGHTEMVRGVRWLLDDTRLLTWSADGTLRFWDRNGRALGDPIEAHSKRIWGTASADSPGIIASWDEYGEFRLWDYLGTPLADSPARTPGSTSDGISEIIWLRDPDELLCLHALGFIRLSCTGRLLGEARCDKRPLWLAGERKLLVLRGATMQQLDIASAAANPAPVAELDRIRWAFALGGEGRMICCTDAGGLQLRDDTGRVLVEVPGEDAQIHGATWIPSTRRMLTTGEDGGLRLWDAQCTLIAAMRIDGQRICDARWDPRSERILSRGYDGRIVIWERDGRLLQSLRIGNNLSHASWLPDGNRILVECDDRFEIHDLAGEMPPRQLLGHAGVIRGGTVSDELKRILTWGKDSTIRFWDFDGQPVGNPFRIGTDASPDPDPDDEADPVTDIRMAGWFDAAGRLLAWTADGTMHVWNLAGRKLGAHPAHADGIGGWLWLEQPRRLLTWGANVETWSSDKGTSWSDGVLRLWDRDGNPAAEPMIGHTRGVSGVLALDDERQLLSWSIDGTLRLWDMHGRSLAAFSPFGGQIVEVSRIGPSRFTVVTNRFVTMLDLDLLRNGLSTDYQSH